MEPNSVGFGAGLSHTVFNPVVGIAVFIAIVFICFSSRNKALAAFLAVGMLIPPDQVLVLGALHFPVLRILVVLGMLRILSGRVMSGTEIFSGGMNGIDKAVILFGLFTTFDGYMLWRDTPYVSIAVVYYLGNLVNIFGVYFLLRALIRDEADVQRMIRVFIYITAVIAVFMAFERVTGRNLIYGMLGGFRSESFGTAMARDDKFRAAGPFGHPILAGTFGAIMLPLFIGLWLKDKNKRNLAILGVIASAVVTISGNSSTALLGFAAGLLSLCLWPIRRLMRPLRWGLLLMLVSLHMVMKNPVWHLIESIDMTGSSSSYHRYELVNQCILHFSTWAAFGTWLYPQWGFDMWDLSNQYVQIAETTGLIPLLLFLAMIVLGFRYVGKARKASEGDKPQELFLWALGAAMFSNVVAYFGTSYWDQTVVVWYALLVAIPVAAAAAPQLAPQAVAKVARPGLPLRPRLVPNSARGRLPN